MILEGCQGKRGPVFQEIRCPNCGRTVELASTDVKAECDYCRFTIYNDLMECVFNCPKARECVGDRTYERMMASKKDWEEYMAQLTDDDEW